MNLNLEEWNPVIESREAILNFVEAGDWSAHDEAILHGLLDNYAHALAEVQRRWADTMKGSPTGDSVARIICEGADKIDPLAGGDNNEKE